MNNETWIEMMKYQESIRLFSNLYIRKAKKGFILSANEIDALFRIALAEPYITPLQLTHKMGSSKSIVSRIIECLCRKKLIIKQFDQEDKRSYSLVITEQGSAELDKMYKYYLAPIYKLRDSIDEEQFENLMALIAMANSLNITKER